MTLDVGDPVRGRRRFQNPESRFIFRIRVVAVAMAGGLYAAVLVAAASPLAVLVGAAAVLLYLLADRAFRRACGSRIQTNL